jgi:hypothetical protein
LNGCAEFNLKEKNIHLCGKSGFEEFKKIFDAVYEYCSKNIKKFDDNN